MPVVTKLLPNMVQEYESLDYDPYDTSLSQRTLASKPRSVRLPSLPHTTLRPQLTAYLRVQTKH